MILFFISAALLVALCLFWLLFGQFRTSSSATDQEAVNITLARERGATLVAALSDGSIDQATYDYEREQLQYDLAADLRFDSEQNKTRKGGHVGAAIVVAVFVPVAAGALYLQLGNPAAMTQSRSAPQASAVQTQTPGTDGEMAPALSDLLPQLEERLSTAPDDVEGWRLLGRSYISVSDFPKARNAFEKALALDERDVGTLAQLAESIAMIQGGELAGEPMAYLERSNAITPTHEHTLWLLSIGRQQAGDHQAALEGFDQLSAIAQGNPEALATIEQMRSQSVQALSGAGTSTERAQQVQPEKNEAAASNAASIAVTVSLNDDVTVNPQDAVFIYARATQGPPMPLAVSRLTVQELPVTVILDDSMAMIPAMTLSAFPEVTVGARVSPSGNPIAQSGDWFAEQSNITVSDTDGISLTIDTQTP